LTSSTNAQASTQGSPQSGSVFAPALGNPNPGLSDVQRPSETAPCGGQTIGSNLGSSTPVAVGSNMQFNIQVTSFGACVYFSRPFFLPVTWSADLGGSSAVRTIHDRSRRRRWIQREREKALSIAR
jgi:hypothetical protein